MLVDKTTQKIISENVLLADTYFKRLKGLMFTKELPKDYAMYITPCGRIHTFNMNYSIDVLYLNTHNTVVCIDEDLKPGKIGKDVKNVISVVELPSGSVKTKEIKVGDVVSLKND